MDPAMSDSTSTSLFSRISDTARLWRNPEGRPVERALVWFAVYAVVLTLVFLRPLSDYARFAWRTELYSHVFLVPLVSIYLIRQGWASRPGRVRGSPVLAIVPAVLGGVALRAGGWLGQRGLLPEACDQLLWPVLGWWCFLWAGLLALVGAGFVRAYLLPVLLTVFVLPMPSGLRDAVEIFLQHASAEAAAWMFWLTGTTLYRDGLIFQLPGLTIMVAQECSGVRSTYVLFIVSWVAAYWFLRSHGLRAVLVASVIPLAILRNAFRIVTISLLTLHVDPRVIDSPLHSQGGPIFFALSLIPFLVLVWGLRWWEQRRAGADGPATAAAPGGVGAGVASGIGAGDPPRAGDGKTGVTS